jgi:TonB family protein
MADTDTTPSPSTLSIKLVNGTGVASDYLHAVLRKIKTCWFPGGGFDTELVSIIFSIDHTGKLSNIRFDHASENTNANKAAMRALETAMPYPPLPHDASRDVEMKVTFNGE